VDCGALGVVDCVVAGVDTANVYGLVANCLGVHCLAFRLVDTTSVKHLDTFRKFIYKFFLSPLAR
jgi:hypothetical protein